MKFGGFGCFRLQKWGSQIHKVSKLWGVQKTRHFIYENRNRKRFFRFSAKNLLSTRSRKSGIEWIEVKNYYWTNRNEATSPLELLWSATTSMSSIHFILRRSFSLTKWCYTSQGKWTFLRNLHCHRITLVELFVFNIAPSSILSWHVSCI